MAKNNPFVQIIKKVEKKSIGFTIWAGFCYVPTPNEIRNKPVQLLELVSIRTRKNRWLNRLKLDQYMSLEDWAELRFWARTDVQP